MKKYHFIVAILLINGLLSGYAPAYAQAKDESTDDDKTEEDGDSNNDEENKKSGDESLVDDESLAKNDVTNDQHIAGIGDGTTEDADSDEQRLTQNDMFDENKIDGGIDEEDSLDSEPLAKSSFPDDKKLDVKNEQTDDDTDSDDEPLAKNTFPDDKQSNVNSTQTDDDADSDGNGLPQDDTGDDPQNNSSEQTNENVDAEDELLVQNDTIDKRRSVKRFFELFIKDTVLSFNKRYRGPTENSKDADKPLAQNDLTDDSKLDLNSEQVGRDSDFEDERLAQNDITDNNRFDVEIKEGDDLVFEDERLARIDLIESKNDADISQTSAGDAESKDEGLTKNTTSDSAQKTDELKDTVNSDDERSTQNDLTDDKLDVEVDLGSEPLAKSSFPDDKKLDVKNEQTDDDADSDDEPLAKNTFPDDKQSNVNSTQTDDDSGSKDERLAQNDLTDNGNNGNGEQTDENVDAEDERLAQNDLADNNTLDDDIEEGDDLGSEPLAQNDITDDKRIKDKTDQTENERLATNTTTDGLDEGADRKNEAMASVDPEKDLAVNDPRTEDEKAKFFMKAFGIEMPTIFYPHEMQVILDQNITVVMMVDINPYSQEMQFATSALVPFFEEYLLTGPVRDIFGGELPEKIDQAFLIQQGFELELDMKYQTISITSPVDIRREQDMSLRSGVRMVYTEPIGPKPISGYMNMSHDFIAIPIRVYDGHYRTNINIQDWVVQNELQYNTYRVQRTSVTGARVIKDFTDQKIRLTIGDNSSPNIQSGLQKQPLAGGFQQTLVGLDVSSTRQMFRISTDPTDFSHTITVREEARIDVYINGRKVSSRIVPSGKYVLQDLPFQTGRNNITISIVGEEGVLEEITLEYFYNPSLLRKGQREFQFVFGLPYEDGVSNVTQIDADQFTSLGYVRYGFSDHVGTTGYLQTVRDNLLIGAIGEVAFESNILSVETAYSNNDDGRSGQALRLQAYSSNGNYLTQEFNFLPNYYTLGLVYTSREFDPVLMGENVNNATRAIISPSFIWQLNQSSQIQTFISVQNQYDGTNIHSYRIRGFYRTRQWLLNASLEKSIGTNNNELTLYTNATWRPRGKPRQRYNHRYNTNTKQHSVSAFIRPEENNAINYQWNSNILDIKNSSHNGMVQYQTMGQLMSVGVNRSKSSGLSNNELSFDYFGPRTLMDLTYSRYQERGSQLTMGLDTSIAFVDRFWGVSRPINNSFAILYPNNEGLKDGVVHFKTGSVLDKYSAAVFPTLGNYRTMELKVDKADVPLGLDLGPQKYVMHGRLNSGQAIPVGKPGGIIIARATLLRPNGEPLERDVGTFIYNADPELTVQFFTNSKGQLFVSGLKDGEYTVDVLGDTYTNITVTIPKDAESPLDLGELMLEESEE